MFPLKWYLCIYSYLQAIELLGWQELSKDRSSPCCVILTGNKNNFKKSFVPFVNITLKPQKQMILEYYLPLTFLKFTQIFKVNNEPELSLATGSRLPVQRDMKLRNSSRFPSEQPRAKQKQQKWNVMATEQMLPLNACVQYILFVTGNLLQSSINEGTQVLYLIS